MELSRAMHLEDMLYKLQDSDPFELLLGISIDTPFIYPFLSLFQSMFLSLSNK